MKKFIRKNSKSLIIIISVIIISVIGITLAYTMNDIGVTVAAGEYNVVYNGQATLPSAKLQPIYDSELLSSDNIDKVMKVEFTVRGAQSNPTDKEIIYDVSLTNLNLPEELQSEHLKWRLYKNDTQLTEGNFSLEFDAQANNRMVLTTMQQDLPDYSEVADSYTFYIWISEPCIGNITQCTPDMDTSPLINKMFSGEIRIELSTGNKKTIRRFTGKSANTLGKLTPLSNISTKSPNFGVISPEILSYKEIKGNSGNSSVNSTYYVTYADNYTFNKDTGLYSLVEPVARVYSQVYESLVGKYIPSTTLSTSPELATYTNLSTMYYVVSSSYDGNANLGVIEFKENTSSIDKINETDTGIFSAEDDLGTSYYYRGNVTNNYVNFAGFYWRIVRINGDGTIRMIYDGTTAHKNGEVSTDRHIGRSVFNNKGGDKDNAFVGYMNGTIDGTYFPSGGKNSKDYSEAHANITNSVVKSFIDSWYEENLLNTEYEQYIADAIYCNDREISNADSSYTGDGSGITKTTYMARERLRINSANNPTLKCEQENDRFTVNDKIGSVIGNGDLTYPIALITADELSFGGGKWPKENIINYFYTGGAYFTMSPYYFSGTNSQLFYESAPGSHLPGVSTNLAYVKPVISLKSDAITSGTGTMTDPFKVG